MKTNKSFLAIILSLAMLLSLISGMSLTAQADNPKELSLSLNGAQYGSYTVSVGGEDTTLSDNGSRQISANTGAQITITFSPTESGQVEEFYFMDSDYREYNHKNEIVNNSYTFTLTDETAHIVVSFSYKNRVENVSYVDELGVTHSVAATILTGAEFRHYHAGYFGVVLGEDNEDTWYALKDNVTYSDEYLHTYLELRGDVHLIVADGTTLSVKGKIERGSLDNGAIDTLSIYGQTNLTGTVSVGEVRCNNLYLYSAKLTAGSVYNNRVDIKGGTLAVNGNVSTTVLDISGGTTTISGTAQMIELTLGCRSYSDSITINTYDNIGDGTRKYADGQELTDGIEVYSGQIYNSIWPHGKTLRKVDNRIIPTVTTPTVKTGLVYNGSLQELVKAGETNGGTMQYALGADATTAPTSGWDISIPTATASGTYYVWYKVVADENYKGVDAQYVGTPSVISPKSTSGGGNSGRKPYNNPDNKPDNKPDDKPVSDNVITVNEKEGTAIVVDEVTGDSATVLLEVITEGKVYRMYDPNRGEHFYTKSVEEAEYLESLGWHHESDGDFNVPSAEEKDSTPVYRLYNSNDGGMHFFTPDADEAKYLESVVWDYEGISYYAYISNTDMGQVQHRIYNPCSSLGEHNWTTSENEKDMLVGLGWIYEGVCWRVI